MAPCPLNNKVIVIRKQKECSVNCCWLELLLGRCRALPPVVLVLNLAEVAALRGKVRLPIPSISSAPKTKQHRKERDKDVHFSQHPSFQFLYGECSPDPRTTKPLSFLFFLWRVGLVFPLQFHGFCNLWPDFQRYVAGYLGSHWIRRSWMWRGSWEIDRREWAHGATNGIICMSSSPRAHFSFCQPLLLMAYLPSRSASQGKTFQSLIWFQFN